jgi:hypothetical protein
MMYSASVVFPELVSLYLCPTQLRGFAVAGKIMLRAVIVAKMYGFP